MPLYCDVSSWPATQQNAALVFIHSLDNEQPVPGPKDSAKAGNVPCLVGS